MNYQGVTGGFMKYKLLLNQFYRHRILPESLSKKLYLPNREQLQTELKDLFYEGKI